MAANNNNEENSTGENKTGFSMGELKKICVKYKKYIATGAMLILLAIVISTQNINNDSPKSQNDPLFSSSTDGEGQGQADSEAFKVDEYPEINGLFEEYYKCFAAGDVAGVEKVAYPVSDTEKSYIELMGSYLDKYENIKCYTKQGVKDGEYTVAVVSDMKFQDIDSGAPGVDYFYVRKDENGAFYIDNTYNSQSKLSDKESAADEKVKECIAAFEQQQDVINLQREVQSNYDAALAKDEQLKEMVTKNVQDAVSAWVDSFTQTDTDDGNTQNKADGTSSSADNLKRTAYAKTDVNMRTKRNADSDLIRTLKAGTKVTIYGVSKDGWFKVKAKGDTGFVSKDYIVSDPSKVEGAEGSSQSNENQTKRTAYTKEEVNLRKGRSTDSDIVKTLKGGLKVTVYGESQSGWYKVKAGSDTGYIRKDYIVFDKSKVKKTETGNTGNTSSSAKTRTAYAKTTVNMREKRSTSSDVLRELKPGTKVTIYGTSQNGWFKIKSRGKTGFVKKEYIVSDKSKVKKEDNSTPDTTSSPSYYTEGERITLSDGVNVRQAMSESSDLVGTAFQGDTVTVVMSYAEGWTKVNWNGKTGYIKTDVLR